MWRHTASDAVEITESKQDLPNKTVKRTPTRGEYIALKGASNVLAPSGASR
jgi:hypothetical protein